MNTTLRTCAVALVLTFGSVLASASGWAQAPAAQTPPTAATSAQVPAQRAFTTPEAAADTLTQALRGNDDKTIAAILGAGWRDFVPGSQAEEDRQRASFLKSWDEEHKVVTTGDKAVVQVGKSGFALPIPLVRESAGWRFDVAAGRKAIQARYIGRNELNAVQTLLAIGDAERDYAAQDPMKTGSPVYARRLLSSPGLKDGLYWPAAPGEPQSPLGALVAHAQPDVKEGGGYYGYHFRLLYGQGPDAPGGAYSYLVNGRMIGGFAAIAWPVSYGDTGVMTFIVSFSGQVYEQDLGPDTAQRAGNIAVFNPDAKWQKADMTPP